MPLDTTPPYLGIVFLLLILILAWVAARYIGSRGKGFARSKYIHLLDTMFISRDKSVMLLEVGKKIYFVGTTNSSMQLLGELDKEGLLDYTGKNEATGADNINGALYGIFAGIKKLKDSPKNLMKARAELKEKDESDFYTAENKDRLENGKKSLNGKFKLVDPQKKPMEAAGENDDNKEAVSKFKIALRAMENKETAYEETDEKEVMVELTANSKLTTQEDNKQKREKRGKRAKTTKEDEIDKMLKSIEEKTKALKDKNPRNEGK